MNNIRYHIGVALLAFLGFLFSWVAFYPGFMSPDSLVQYEIAKTLDFNDWHPPVMSWLWSILNVFFEGPQGLLFFHLALLWGGLYSWYINCRESRFAWLFIVIGFLPWVVNFEGVLWKDVGMAFSLLLAIGLLGGKKLTSTKISIAAVLLIYAFLVRANAL